MKNALYNIGYGLYLLTTKDEYHNGCIVNAVIQVTDTPEKVAVTINKNNFSCDTALKTSKMNICCLDTSAPFGIFERFGFQSGRDTKKFDGLTFGETENELAYLKSFVNAVISLEVCQTVELSTHIMFICNVTEKLILSDKESMTYAYYHKNVKPEPKKVKGYVCKICGYVYEGDPLPSDFICPLCKHPASDFERITE